MKHIFIVNPISGHGSGAKTVPIIEKICEKHQVDYEIVQTEYHKHAKEIATRYFINDDVCLYAVGGDGTANEVLNGLNDQVQMAVIPAGSGNDFYRSVSTETDLKKIIEETILGDAVKVDYGVANDFRFINILSVGFDAEINYQVNEKYRDVKLIPSKVIYMYAALAMIFKPRPFHIRYTVDGKEIDGVAMLLAVANGRRYGGGFNVAPMAKINDGVLNLVMIDFVKVVRTLQLLPKYFKGEHINIKEAHFNAGSDVKITSSEPMNYNVDGEVIKTDKMTITLYKQALNLRVPRCSLEDFQNED